MQDTVIDPRYVTGKRDVFFALAAEYIKEGDAVLDAGCGDGSFAAQLKMPGMHMIDNCQENIELLKDTFPNSVRASVTAMPYPDNMLDVIHCSHVVEHLVPEDVYKFLKESMRCLRPGGYLIVSTPLLWYGFYDDLSHVRPYPPTVFLNYLTGEQSSRARGIIGGFQQERIIYRYCRSRDIIKMDGGRVPGDTLERNGYTIILRKNI